MILKYELLNFKLKFKDNDLRYSSQNDYILDIIFIQILTLQTISIIMIVYDYN
ncbi:MAG: hypothetical protein PWP15_195 [Methanothermococcus sp.]|jgi:hypothetical protein|nr:hypothetical protein [Methanothermococcus sp.]MDK2987459.1 hypothetical protein [Methanothermococcus sp.]